MMGAGYALLFVAGLAATDSAWAAFGFAASGLFLVFWRPA